MYIGENIKYFRREAKINQKEFAKQLGVSEAEVRKWEHEQSNPSIELLVPIAETLQISLDTLLKEKSKFSFSEMMSLENEFMNKLKTCSLDEAVHWAEEIVRNNPKNYEIILHFAATLLAFYTHYDNLKKKKLGDFIKSLMENLLKSKNREDVNFAANSLVVLCMDMEDYDEALKYLEYLDIPDDNKNKMLVEIYVKSGKFDEAYERIENELIMNYQNTDLALQQLSLIALRCEDEERALKYAYKAKELAKCYEMGIFYELFCDYRAAIIEKDLKKIIKSLQGILDNINNLGEFKNGMLYEHTEPQETDELFILGVEGLVMKILKDQDLSNMIKRDKEWKELLKNLKEKKKMIRK